MLISYCQDLYNYLVDNASYSPSTNDVTINTSNLLPPYVDAKDEEPLTLVSLASSICHELTHGFDSSGRRYDKYGAKTDWWTPADTAKFVLFADQLVDNYNQLLMMPWASKTLYCNGKGTLILPTSVDAVWDSTCCSPDILTTVLSGSSSSPSATFRHGLSYGVEAMTWTLRKGPITTTNTRKAESA